MKKTVSMSQVHPMVVFWLGLLTGAVIVSLILIAVSFAYYRKQKTIPGKFQAAVEGIFEAILGFFDAITNDREKTRNAAKILLQDNPTLDKYPRILGKLLELTSNAMPD